MGFLLHTEPVKHPVGGIVTQIVVETMEDARHFVDTFGLPVIATIEGVIVLVADHEGVEHIVAAGLTMGKMVIIGKESAE